MCVNMHVRRVISRIYFCFSFMFLKKKISFASLNIILSHCVNARSKYRFIKKIRNKKFQYKYVYLEISNPTHLFFSLLLFNLKTKNRLIKNSNSYKLSHNLFIKMTVNECK